MYIPPVLAVLAVVGWFPPNQLVMLGSGLTFTAPALLICPSGPWHAATSLTTQRHSRAAHQHSRLLHVNIRKAIKTHC